MIDWNGFDKGVIGKKLPSDSTLNNMKKSDLIELLHIADHNHKVLAATYHCSVENSMRLLKEEHNKATDECIDKFADILSNIKEMCGRNCPVNCNWGTTTNCKDMCRKWLAEQLNQQKKRG